MSTTSLLTTLRSELRNEVTEHILRYWMQRTLDAQNGGFVGRITHDNQVVEEAAKGVVLNARILWTFAAAYRILWEMPYRRLAERAYAYLDDYFWDQEHGGVYWMLDCGGQPCDDRKHVYAQAFALYGLSEYYRATEHRPGLDRAIELYRLIEEHSHDAVHGGYHEAYSRDWHLLDDVRLSEKDADEQKSMNTHLHVLEAYTNLYRVWPDPDLRTQLEALLEVFLTAIVDSHTGHMRTFFDEDWTPKSNVVSYGHDIEASWLLLEAADVLGDASLRAQVRDRSVNVARAILREGQDRDGGLFNEGSPDGLLDADKHWWPQAEAIVGFLNAYQETSEADFLEAAVDSWTFIQHYIIDNTYGEWYERVSRDGTPYDGADKAGPWKGPYHNARACFEVMARVDELLEPDADPVDDPASVLKTNEGS